MILLAYLVFVIVTFPIMLRRDRLFGTIYGLLFLYSFFSLLGYLYFPGFSESLNAFFGIRAGLIAARFIFASMALLFFFNFLLYRRDGASSLSFFGVPLEVRFVDSPYSPLVLGTWIFIFAVSLIAHWSDLSWYIAEEESLSRWITAYLFMFKLSVGLLAAIYVANRENLPGARRLRVIAIIYLILFLTAAVKLGNRTDPAALTVAILFYESCRQSLRLKTVLSSFLFILLVALSLSLIEYYRYDQVINHTTLTERVIRNDYFAPAHMLYASIAFNYINFGEVLRSDFSNALILMNYPYLQQTVTDLFSPGIATRSAGYAFYLLSEGYMAFGKFGVLYNAVVVTCYIRLWNAFTLTDNKSINVLIRTVFASMAINICRGQSSYFIKLIYTFAAPVLIMTFVVLGVRIAWRKAVV